MFLRFTSNPRTHIVLFLLVAATASPRLTAQTASSVAPSAKTTVPQGPVDPRAIKSYQEGLDLERKQQLAFAMDSYRKADKQDGNRCAACARKIVTIASETGDYKSADAAALELITLAATPEEQAEAHKTRSRLLLSMGTVKKKQECFADGEKESDAALALKPGDTSALYLKGMCLAHEEQDDAARKVFQLLETKLRPGSLDYGRVTRYAERPELARARMAPAFRVTTMEGKQLSLDELKNKVVLVDFWATWCGPCKEALPTLQKLAKKFDGQPLVVISVSLDDNEAKWKDFVAKNNMTWPQYRDGGWNGAISKMFDVKAIPHTFTIDADGVLQDERIGDDGLDGKLKKLVAQARERQQAAPAVAAVTTNSAPK